MTNCKFCEIVNGKHDYKIWENNDCIAILDIHPAKPGHIMLIPKQHIEDIFCMEPQAYTRFFSITKELSKLLADATNAKRIGMVLSGFEIAHAHLHLIPLHKAHELFDAKEFPKAIQSDLIAMQDKLQKAFHK